MIAGIIKISVFTSLLAVVTYFLNILIEPDWIHPSLYSILIFMWAVHVTIHVITERSKERLNIENHLLLLAGVAARLILALFGLILLSRRWYENEKVFALNFSVVYLLFLVFEITTVLSNLRPNSSRDRRS